MDMNQSLLFSTSSFVVNYFKVYPINRNLQTGFIFQDDSSIKSHSILLEKYLDQVVFIKVKTIFKIL